MDTAQFFLKGLIVGFLVAAPVGPVAVMCIHRTIAHGRMAGYICGLGATIADTIFGAMAALGLGFIASLIIAHQGWIRIIGGAILVVMGLRLAFSRHLTPKAEAAEAREEEADHTAQPTQGIDAHMGNFASAFAVMITNPITLISFAAIFAAINIAHIGEKTVWGLALIAGVFMGGALWWTILVLLSSLFRNRIDEPGIIWVNRGSGALIFIFGIILLFWPGTLPGSD